MCVRSTVHTWSLGPVLYLCERYHPQSRKYLHSTIATTVHAWLSSTHRQTQPGGELEGKGERWQGGWQGHAGWEGKVYQVHTVGTLARLAAICNLALCVLDMGRRKLERVATVAMGSAHRRLIIGY